MPKTRGWLMTVGVISILLLALVLRFKNLAFIPRPGESMDEYSNAWVGLSLIRMGVPVGRSGLVGYHGNDYRYINVDHFFSDTAGGNPLGINKPWFDHPPFLGLITGGYAYLSGSRVFEDTNARVIRRPMIIVGVVAVGLTGILAYLLFGTLTSFLVMTLMGTSPLMAISSRMGQGENLLIVFWLLNLICLWQYLAKHERKWLWLAGITSGLTILSKVSGVVSVITGGIILLNQPNKKLPEVISEIFLYSIVGLSFLAMFFVYGGAINWKVFLDVWFSNADRPYDIGYSPIFDLITTTKLTISKLLTDGWPLLGWFGAITFTQSREQKAKLFLLLPIVIYLIFFLVMGSSSYGWYRTPFMPFLFIAGGWFLAIGFNKSSRILQAIFLLIPLGINIGKIGEIISLASIKPYLRLGLPLIVLIFCLAEFLPKQVADKYRVPLKFFYLTLITAAVISNVILIWIMTPEYWLKIN